MYTYHVTCNVEKKLINIDHKDRPTVFSALRSTFKIDGDFLLQLWDADFCDWIDLTETESLPDKAKLLIIVPGQFRGCVHEIIYLVGYQLGFSCLMFANAKWSVLIYNHLKMCQIFSCSAKHC